MQFLVALAAKLFIYAVERLAAYLMAIKRKTDRWKEIDREAEKSVEKLKKAKDGKEVDDAVRDTLNGI